MIYLSLLYIWTNLLTKLTVFQFSSLNTQFFQIFFDKSPKKQMTKIFSVLRAPKILLSTSFRRLVALVGASGCWPYREACPHCRVISGAPSAYSGTPWLVVRNIGSP